METNLLGAGGDGVWGYVHAKVVREFSRIESTMVDIPRVDGSWRVIGWEIETNDHFEDLSIGSFVEREGFRPLDGRAVRHLYVNVWKVLLLREDWFSNATYDQLLDLWWKAGKARKFDYGSWDQRFLWICFIVVVLGRIACCFVVDISEPIFNSLPHFDFVSRTYVCTEQVRKLRSRTM